MRKIKRSLKDRVRKVYGTFATREVPYAKAINGNAEVLKDLIDEVEFLRANVADLARAEFAFDRSAEIEQIVNAEMERRTME